MAIVKGSFESHFVTIYNETARDTRLSLQARGLLLYLLSLPGDWSLSRKNLAKENGINEKTIQKYLNELKENGYATYVSTRKKGSFTGGDYHIFPVLQKDLLKPVKASKTSTSTGDPKSGSPANGVAQEVGQHTKKDLNKIKSSSSKPAEAVFQFDLVLAWVITQLSNVHDLNELDQAFIEASLEEYQQGATKPSKSRALSWVEVALLQRLGTEHRSVQAGQARNKLNQSVVNQLEIQAAVIDGHTKTMQPRKHQTMQEKLTDRTWADGLKFNDDHQAG